MIPRAEAILLQKKRGKRESLQAAILAERFTLSLSLVLAAGVGSVALASAIAFDTPQGTQAFVGEASARISHTAHEIVASVARATRTAQASILRFDLGGDISYSRTAQTASAALAYSTAQPIAEATSTQSLSASATQQPSDTGTTTIVRNYITQPVIERIVATTLPPDNTLATRLQSLETHVTSQLAMFSAALSQPQASYVPVPTFAASQRIDQLANVTLTNPTITGGSVTATAFSGTIGPSQGGTGITSAPAYGQLFLGNASGGYTLVATSSLGIASNSTWGSITGTLSDQTDLQSALNAKLSLSSWFSTTTTALAEGDNLYFTSARATSSFIQNLAATTSVASIATLPSLSLPYAQLTGTPSLSSYFTLAGWYATTTDALAQGSTNKYYSDTLVNAYLHASTTVPKTYTENAWTALQQFNANASTTQLTTTGSTYLATTGGNVGIGTTSPAAALAVNGNIYLPAAPTASSTYKILLHMDGTDGSTTFTNSAAGVTTVTAYGNAQIDTAVSKFGGAAGLFDNSGDYLSFTSGTNQRVVFSNNFTIDFWINPTSLQTTDYILYAVSDDVGYASAITFDANGSLYATNSGLSITCGAGTITTGSWQHIALVRSGSTATLYKNGTSCGSDTTATGDFYIIGAQYGYIGGTQYFHGSIDEFRATDVAVWTANFTAPSAAYDPTLSYGGIGLGVSNPSYPIQHSSGANLSTGGTWTNASDRALKENFASVDGEDILSRISGLPITKWNYIAEGGGTPHIGPVAQDFYEQFALGNSSTTISTIDSAGIALVGVKALNEKLESLASTTVTTTNATGTPTFLGRFFTRLAQWLGDASNGVANMFAGTIHAQNQLCVGDVCVNPKQFQTMVAASAGTHVVASVLESATSTEAAAATSTGPMSTSTTPAETPPPDAQ